jgi:hypothetical protein
MIDAKPAGQAASSIAQADKSQTRITSGLFAFALAAPLTLGLSACSGIGGTTYGTGESQEAALLDDVTSGLGIIPKTQKDPIDYSARAGLVLPPEGTALPAPEDGSRVASSAAANWPQDPDRLRKLYHERMETMTEAERQRLLAAIRRLPPEQRDEIIKNDPRATSFANQIKEPDPMTASAAELAAYEKQVQERKALIRLKNGEGVKGRQYLTQPPERFTQTTPEIEREMAKIDPEKQNKEKKGLFSKIWPF